MMPSNGYYNAYAPPSGFVTGSAGSTSHAKAPKQKEEEVTYFVPGYGISRQVIIGWYQQLLGPSATIRPFTYQKREGYMITNAGKPLTQDQIEDLKRLSFEYEQREAMRMASRSGHLSREDTYINRPVPVQSRRRYL